MGGSRGGGGEGTWLAPWYRGGVLLKVSGSCSHGTGEHTPVTESLWQLAPMVQGRGGSTHLLLKVPGSWPPWYRGGGGHTPVTESLWQLAPMVQGRGRGAHLLLKVPGSHGTGEGRGGGAHTCY
jgi:hypothetical protein